MKFQIQYTYPEHSHINDAILGYNKVTATLEVPENEEGTNKLGEFIYGLFCMEGTIITEIRVLQN